jgi:hypothetical protein
MHIPAADGAKKAKHHIESVDSLSDDIYNQHWNMAKYSIYLKKLKTLIK